ncbi:hypothetical protein [Terasakiispira papahanaumokuakeensis]|nr:hypothetical protein [Terasakiispira papahanaumokuakeensis]
MKRSMIPAMVFGIAAVALSATSMAQGRYEVDQGAVGNMHTASIQSLVAEGQSQAMAEQIQRSEADHAYGTLPETQVKSLVAEGQSGALAELTLKSAQQDAAYIERTSTQDPAMQNASASQDALNDLVSEGHSAAQQDHIENM